MALATMLMERRGRVGRRRPLLRDILFAIMAVAVATGVRLLIDLRFPKAIAFPLVFPAIAFATFAASGRSGLMVIVGGQLLIWYFIVPIRGSFKFASAGDAVSLVLSTSAELLLLWALVTSKAAVAQADALQAQRRNELEEQVELLRRQAVATEELEKRERALKESRSNLEAIYEASGDGLALCQAIFDAAGHVIEYQVLEVNRAHAELTGASRETMLRQRVSTIHPPIDARWFETAERVLKSGVTQNFDIRSRATGRWLNIRVSRVSDDLFQQTFVDVSDRRLLEEQRQALMKEMSHRVLNNFQMVAAFLRLQASEAEAGVKPQLQTAERRVQVLARLHSLLAYEDADGDSHVDAGAYVQELCGHLQSLIERPGHVSVTCEASSLRLPTDKVVPLGFVISELVTNSIKYAFPAPRTGGIHVTLRDGDGGHRLSIRDNGCGLPEGGAVHGGGLGMRLVRRFVQQIDGELTTTSAEGVHHEVVFPR